MTRENIDEISKFLVIHQNVPYQIFLLAIANVMLGTDLSIFYFSNFSHCQLVNISLLKNFHYMLLATKFFNEEFYHS